MVTYELDGRVAKITMDDGKANALAIPMLKEVHSAFDQAEKDAAIVLFTGREKYFSAGFDLKVFTETPEDLLEMIHLGGTLCERVLSFPFPVVTASPGHTLAAGTFLTLCADYRIGLEGDWKYGLNEVKIGLTMPQYVIEMARQRLTPAEFSRAIVTGRIYTPDEAAAAGFIDTVVSAEDFESACAEATAEMETLNVEAHAATKLRARAGTIAALRKAIEEEIEAHMPGEGRAS